MSSPQHSMLTEDCIELTSAPMEPQLNASTLYDPSSLMITLIADLLPTTNIHTLIDSGLTHCFLNSSTVSKQQLHSYKINSILLQLFDGSHHQLHHLLCHQPSTLFPFRQQAICHILHNSIGGKLYCSAGTQLTYLLQSLD